MWRVALTVASVLVGFAAIAMVLLLEGDEPETEAGRSGQVEAGTVRFLLDDVYAPGERVQVKIENVGSRSYRYQVFYAACFLSYFDSTGREITIPLGTHCDILGEDKIDPGEVRKLFGWRLNECMKDRWGCVESRPLRPGTYTVRGRFKAEYGGPPAVAETTFRIARS